VVPGIDGGDPARVELELQTRGAVVERERIAIANASAAPVNTIPSARTPLSY
jgi:hypothetical protein